MRALEALNLNHKEQQTYLATLKIGRSSARKISEASGVSRELTYHVLEKLEKQGLVTKDNAQEVIHFEVIHPQRLLHILDEKRAAVTEDLPKLIELQKKEEIEGPKTQSYKGKEGIKALAQKILSKYPSETPLLGFGKAGALDDTLQWAMKHLIDERVNKNIYFRGVYYNNLRVNEKKKLKNAEIRVLKQESPAPTFTFIYPEAVAIAILGENPVAIEIESTTAYNAYKEQFEILWESAK